MNNFYSILGVRPEADAAEIKAAFKRLAMEYHPDRNPGNRQAEEMFKVINEAYHTLSDPLKKSRYDAMMNYNQPEAPEIDWREENRRRFLRWQMAQQKQYRFGKEYFKIQGLAFLVFTVIAGFCFALLHTATYVVKQQRTQHYQANSKALQQVDQLFSKGQFNDAFALIQTLGQEDPLEIRFRYAHDSLLHSLQSIADEHFETKDFSEAVAHYLVLKKHEDPVRMETLRQIALCQFYLGNYAESIQALKHLHNQDPRNLTLVYEIGTLYLDKMENPSEALPYFTLGKKLFDDNLTDVYGTSFELTMKPADVPDIYYEIFQGRARCNLKLKQYDEAVTDCNWAALLRPRMSDPYTLRGLAHAEIKKYDRACADLKKARALGATDAATLQRKYCQ